MADDATPPVEETLAREAERRPLAATSAIVAGVMSLVGTLIAGEALRDRPEVTLPDALRDAAGQPPRSGGLLTETALYIHDKAVSYTVGQGLVAISAPLIAVALVYLARAVSARRPQFTTRAPMIVIAGAVATFVGILVGQISLDISLSDFAGARDHTTAAAHDALQPGGAVAAGFIAFLGHVALGLGMVLIALNAMRVGLLTRFMGVLGILAGVFLAFPFFPVPVVQAFWLVALGVLILGRWPAGVPPAWETGRAEPWPSRQEMIEARGGAGPTPATEPPIASGDGPETDRPAHPRSKKKKRRR